MMNYKKIGCICSLSLLLLACSDDNQDLIQYINEIKHRKTKEVDPLPSFAPLPSFQFPDNGERRSPFKSIAQKKQVDLNEPDTKRIKQPLEAFPLDSLKFVGTLKQGSDTWALIEQPNKDITHVRIGNYMGQNFGRIASISSESIELIETTKSSGKWEKHKTTIKLFTGK
ncbi:MAG: pilus assembly protein PilP [Legionella longbeachae]|nr:pilus assembly protein PilP [Legionella longbeachae]